MLNTYSNLLTADEEKNLLILSKQGNKEAKEKLILSNLRLVAHVAKSYTLHGSVLELDDLINEGTIGLVEAIDYYSLEKNNKFSTYATYWIKKEMSKLLENHNRTIRLPAHVLKNVKAVIKAKELLEKQFGYTPTNQDIADYLNMPIQKVEEVLLYKDDAKSIDTIVEEDNKTTLLDLQLSKKIESPDAVLMRKESKKNIQRLLSKNLTERERDIINQHLGLGPINEPKTLQEIGEQYGLSKERIRQIETSAYKKLNSVYTLREEIYEINR